MEPTHPDFFHMLAEKLHQPHVLLSIVMLLSAGFAGITFLQSSLDKILNYKGNLEWMTQQFSKSILNGTIKIFLPVLTLGEFAAGATSLLGILLFLVTHPHSPSLVIFGLVTSGTVLLMLLFGQRVSKEYAGAASLTGYFLVVAITAIAFNFLADLTYSVLDPRVRVR